MKSSWIVCLLIGLNFPSISNSTNSKKNVRPNIVILIADDISRDDFGCYGHPVIKTPNIDRLSKGGIKFTNAFLTASSCSPSRSSIITGRYPHNTGACELHAPLAKNQVAFPLLLKQAGYYTAQAGKWHFGESKVSGVAVSAFNRTGGSSADGGGPSGAEMWVPYLKERPKERPFFMWFAAHDAHRGWDKKNTFNYSPENVIVPDYMVDNHQTRKDLAAYYKEVSRFDYYVGKVIDELKQQKVLDNTLVIVMADNGRPFPRDKTRLYDSGIITPFIVHFPKEIETTNQVCESLLSVIDIAPTITELAGVKPSEMFQGKSFRTLLHHPDKEFRDYVFAEHNWHDYKAYERMVRTKQFLYIENGLPEQANIGAADVLNGGAGKALLMGMQKQCLNEIQKKPFLIPQPQVELYNCIDDPNQFKNIAGQEDSKSIQKKLKRILSQWQRKTKDTQPKQLTPDWYDRKTMKPLKCKGQRGIMPGSEKKAEEVKTKE
ncbi:heparan N-sulfatase [Prolixibacteraceae bacterium JC049]|nr:heparan N-sulfatase [Prolixibacteraceae bacterium JC049]